MKNNKSIVKATFIALVLLLVLLVGVLIGQRSNQTSGSPTATTQSETTKNPSLKSVSKKCAPSKMTENGIIQSVKIDDGGQGLTAVVSYDMMNDELPDSTVFDCVAKELNIPAAVKTKFTSTLHDADDTEGSEDIHGIHISWTSKTISDSTASLHVTNVNFSNNN